MSYPHHFDNFLHDYLSARGAALQRTGYGILEVLVDERLEQELGKSELVLAFDYDAAQETPESDYITYGSTTLEQIVNLAVSGHTVAERYSPSSGKPPANLAEIVTRHVGLRASDLSISSVKEYLNPVIRFTFKAAHVSDDREEQLVSTWVDGHHEKINRLYGDIKHIFYESSPSRLLPELQCKPLPELLRISLAEVEHFTSNRRLELEAQNARLLAAESERTEAYFGTMMDDCDAVLSRAIAAGDEAQKKQVKAKQDSIEMQRRHHLDDIAQKYNVRLEVSLLSLALYLVPRWRIVWGSKKKTNSSSGHADGGTLFYDELLKKIID